MIRETTVGDTEEILALYPQAFPDEELRPLVSALLDRDQVVLSLAGFNKKSLVAHILFTICGTEEQDQTGALLAPLGVLPSHQKQGLGSSLVKSGLEKMRAKGIGQVFVLGDPGYYRRFGFLPEQHVLAPYPIPEEGADAWQSLSLAPRAPLSAGRLMLPEPWMAPDLWKP